ncbi:hypothetical protein T440DRAFT_556257 [Plenodomus tracheiphilus IPT5]|uniref:Uncharacterized protein n=1 Tax=Plenodomus tracheiphilus IPT5 TaxID=1408161 RepID=A0A6A7B1I7_9PLEO|nr:hypothetical protein T440DRAFT_556257 [Plenodomus tracheiphilus IPT5]
MDTHMHSSSSSSGSGSDAPELLQSFWPDLYATNRQLYDHLRRERSGQTNTGQVESEYMEEDASSVYAAPTQVNEQSFAYTSPTQVNEQPYTQPHAVNTNHNVVQQAASNNATYPLIPSQDFYTTSQNVPTNGNSFTGYAAKNAVDMSNTMDWDTNALTIYDPPIKPSTYDTSPPPFSPGFSFTQTPMECTQPQLQPNLQFPAPAVSSSPVHPAAGKTVKFADKVAVVEPDSTSALSASLSNISALDPYRSLPWSNIHANKETVRSRESSPLTQVLYVSALDPVLSRREMSPPLKGRLRRANAVRYAESASTAQPLGEVSASARVLEWLEGVEEEKEEEEEEEEE